MIISIVLIVFFLILCVLIFVTDSKRDVYKMTCRWIGVSSIVGVIGNIAHAWAGLLPRLEQRGHAGQALHAWLLESANWLYLIFTIIAYYALPYVFFMFAIAFHPELSAKWHRRGLFVLLIPALASLIYSLANAQEEFPRLFVILWIVPYFAAGGVLLIHGFRAECNRLVRGYRLFICCAFIPVVCLVMLKDYVFPVFGVEQEALISWSIGLSTIVFVTYFCIRFGILGVQIKFEKERIIGSVRAVVSSTSMLNHAIKNEIGKIDFQLTKLTKLASHPDSQAILNEIEIARNSTIHLLEVVKRIEYHSRVLEIKEERHSLVDILERSLLMNAASMASEHVEIRKDYQLRPILTVDSVHIQEAFSNIVMNALEALDTDKRIDISIRKADKEICVAFKDYGKGMQEDLLPFALEPFFSTKKNRQNFGLGLSYCLHVMEKHRGRLLFASRLNEGTTVTLCFPVTRYAGEEADAALESPAKRNAWREGWDCK
ncbi:HAMP domain-containing histidine kinase [Paenibacillus athensensis]|uniref:histidine kinase n=1 Tax=Paenibacillus athensensis TaxID=1967502 RepID=A0A4Y8PQQ5_9BACL|nr:HAMP domain-containing sensor histidine kinase [Paenibacillus athensensis]MCD1261741.1 HAMP domain-containing histidine kinase [Paenibacillus athensensis]